MESPLNRKTELRKHYRSLRAQLPPFRRQQASDALISLLENSGRILSFDSMGSEIELGRLNQVLADRGSLLLNRVENGKLVPYFVRSLADLVPSVWKFKEPNPHICQKALFSEIDLILVPGLAFDEEGYRLGYGQGHYDDLLLRKGAIPTKGVGFLEQLSKEPLPRDSWDLPVDQLLLT